MARARSPAVVHGPLRQRRRRAAAARRPEQVEAHPVAGHDVGRQPERILQPGPPGPLERGGVKGAVRYPIGMGLGNFTVYSGTWREVHVAYLQILVEGGIASLVLYLLFFARGFSNLKKLRQLPVHDPQVDLLAGALYATLVGFIVGACFAPEAYQYFPYFAVAYTSVLLAIVKEKETAEGSEAALQDQPQPKWRSRPRLDGGVPLRGGAVPRIPALLRNRR